MEKSMEGISGNVSASTDAVVVPTIGSQTVGYCGDFAHKASDWSKHEVVSLLAETLELEVLDFNTSTTCAAVVNVIQGDNYPLIFDGCFELSVIVEEGYLANLSVSDLGLLLEANKFLGNRGAAAVAELFASRS